MQIINKFANDYAFLSNFYIAPFIYNGVQWKTAEHLFQARKTLAVDARSEIQFASTPGQAKRLGRKVPLRADWEDIKTAVMYECVNMKFSQNILIKKQLMLTEGKQIVEGNYWHDNFWGDCDCSKCLSTPGKNVLGILLMSIRDDFILEEKWI